MPEIQSLLWEINSSFIVSERQKTSDKGQKLFQRRTALDLNFFLDQ